MKKLIIITFLFAFTFSVNAQENWQFKPDKRLHFGVGGAIVVIALPLIHNDTGYWGESINGSILLASSFGIGKEVLDLLKYMATGKGIGFSLADLSYTVFGAVVAVPIVLIGHYIIVKVKEHRQTKRIKELNYISENITFSLDNPIFTNGK